jgi:hypothetical protein
MFPSARSGQLAFDIGGYAFDIEAKSGRQRSRACASSMNLGRLGPYWVGVALGRGGADETLMAQRALHRVERANSSGASLSGAGSRLLARVSVAAPFRELVLANV